MGILIDALSIMLGSLMGSKFKQRVLMKNFSVLGISIMLMSMVGFLENVFDIADKKLVSDNLMIIVFSLIVGSILGEVIKLDERISGLSSVGRIQCNSFIDATLFFAVGGLQISGPILMAVSGDNSQLVLKSVIDLPFAMMFGASYGKSTALSAIPVAAVQVIIAFLAYCSEALLNDALISQICAMGYIVLFFTGFNLICDKKYKINNTNMIPGIIIVLFFNLIYGVMR